MSQTLHRYFEDLRLAQPPLRTAPGPYDYILLWVQSDTSPNAHGTIYQISPSYFSTGGGSLAAANVAAAGTNQGTATALTLARNYVTSGTGGVKLPQASTFNNAIVPVFNRNGATITVYPFLGDQIEANGANTGITLSNNQTAYFSVDANGVVRMA
jgi:hypothetical protein